MRTKNLDWALHWFRRDLRMADNAVLARLAAQSSGKVLGLVCLDPLIRSRADFSADRFFFYLKSVQALQEKLRKLGGDLLVLEGAPAGSDGVFARLFAALDRAGISRPASVSWNRDYEPYARRRDAAVLNLLQKHFRTVAESSRDYLVLDSNDRSDSTGGRRRCSAGARFISRQDRVLRP